MHVFHDKNLIIAQDLNFRNGKKEGEQKEYFDNGVLKSKSKYVNDKLVGEVITYTPGGTIEMKDNYVNGEKEGWCYAYDSNGLEIGKVYYRSGVRLDEKQTKNICSLVFKEKLKAIDINGNRYELEDVSVSSITKLKRELTESALSNLA